MPTLTFCTWGWLVWISARLRRPGGYTISSNYLRPPHQSIDQSMKWRSKYSYSQRWKFLNSRLRSVFCLQCQMPITVRLTRGSPWNKSATATRHTVPGSKKWSWNMVWSPSCHLHYENYFQMQHFRINSPKNERASTCFHSEQRGRKLNKF
jgi:hypothetical protein